MPEYDEYEYEAFLTKKLNELRAMSGGKAAVTKELVLTGDWERACGCWASSSGILSVVEMKPEYLRVQFTLNAAAILEGSKPLLACSIID